jgi:hypothetical protein
LQKLPMSANKRVLLFWGIGAILTVAIAGLASVLPSVFGLFTLPFWILPALAGFGAHDNILMPLGLLGASLFYGALSYLVFWILAGRVSTPKSS